MGKSREVAILHGEGVEAGNEGAEKKQCLRLKLARRRSIKSGRGPHRLKL